MTAPFGIELGTDIGQLEVVSDLGQGKYFVNPAKPHPHFASYVVQATPTHGVVWIKGISAEIENDAYGTATRALADKIAGQLEGRYGVGKKGDVLSMDSIWSDPRDWMAGISNGDRFYHYFWERGERGTTLPEDLTSIFVGANAVDFSTSNVVIEYSSASFEAAEQEIDNQAADLL